MHENGFTEANRIIRFGPVRPDSPKEGIEAESPEEQTVSLGSYWHSLVRRRWTVLSALVIVSALATVITFKMTPVYRGTASVEIDPEEPQIQADSHDAQQPLPTDEGFLRSQAQLLQTDQLAWKTIEQLGLATNDSFVGNASNHHDSDRHDSNYIKQRLIQRFRNDLNVALVPESRVVRVQFDSTDPRLAAEVPNSLVNNYIDYNFLEKYDSTRQAAARMEEQLDELKAKVEKSQKALVDYQREHAIAKVTDKQNVVEQTLGELSTSLTKAQSDRIEKEAVSNLLRSDPSQIASVAQNELLQKLQEKYADLSTQYTDALNQYGPNFPKVVRLRAQVADAKDLIQRERNRVFAKISDDYDAAVRRENLLVGEVARAKEDLGNVNKLLVEQNILSGEFESNQKMYQTLLQRVNEATVSAGLRSTNIHLVDPALTPAQPVRPKKLEYILGGMFAGLLFGIVLALGQEAIDNSLKTMEDAENLVGAPVLAMVPIASTPAQKLICKYAGQSAEGDPAMAVLHQPKSQLAESFRSLRTSVLFSSRQNRQSMLVTSATVGEGKTCTAINLAMALGQRGESAVLVDCDLRRPSVARTMGIDGRKGLTTLLMGRHTLEQVLQPVDGLPSVSILPAGPVAISPSEVLSSEVMATVVRELGERFSHIILDTPPILAVTDASVLAPLVDGVLLVVAGGSTPRKAAVRSRRLLELVGARIIGVVVNKVYTHDGASYGYYGHQYAYGESKSMQHHADEASDIAV